MTARRLLLVRHAKAEVPPGRCVGRTDVALASVGFAEAQALAAALAALPIASIITSPLLRARATASVIAERLALSARHDDRLQEIDFGAWEGRLYDELARDAAASYAAWLADPTDFRFPQGESSGDLQQRVHEAWREHSAGSGMSVIVTHAGVIRTLLATVLDLPRQQLFALGCDPAHVSCLDAVGESWQLRALNWPPSACPLLLTLR